MSATLFMQPRQTGEKMLSDELRRILMKPDGHFGELPVLVNDYSLDYFQGLADAGIKDANKVVEAIKKYGELEIRVGILMSHHKSYRLAYRGLLVNTDVVHAPNNNLPSVCTCGREFEYLKELELHIKNTKEWGDHASNNNLSKQDLTE